MKIPGPLDIGDGIPNKQTVGWRHIGKVMQCLLKEAWLGLSAVALVAIVRTPVESVNVRSVSRQVPLQAHV